MYLVDWVAQMTLTPDTITGIVLIAYVAVGIPVAWLHMRQQRMVESVKQIQLAKGRAMVVFTLAVMWPLLLLAMALAHFQQKPWAIKQPNSGKVSKPEIPSDTERPHQAQ